MKAVTKEGRTGLEGRFEKLVKWGVYGLFRVLEIAKLNNTLEHL